MADNVNQKKIYPFMLAKKNKQENKGKEVKVDTSNKQFSKPKEEVVKSTPKIDPSSEEKKKKQLEALQEARKKAQEERKEAKAKERAKEKEKAKKEAEKAKAKEKLEKVKAKEKAKAEEKKDKDYLKEMARKQAQEEKAELKEREKAKLLDDSVKSNGERVAKERIKRATKTPITYYFNVSRDVSNNLIYCNVNQCLNDKFAGRMYQPQYFSIAENSDRIFVLNNLLIDRAIGCAINYQDVTFCVQVSPKLLENSLEYDKLKNKLKLAPKNILYSFDCRPLVMAGSKGIERLRALVNECSIKVMLDNPEGERMSILFDYPLTYIRLDGRYFADRGLNKVGFVKLLGTYCREGKINLCAKHIDTPDDRSWMIKNGVRFIEGAVVQNIKATVKSAIRPPVKK